MRALQKFSKESLERSRFLPIEEVIGFLEDFRCFHSEGTPQESRSISIRIPKNLLSTFRTKSKIEGMHYQTQIKKLMEEWLATTRR